MIKRSIDLSEALELGGKMPFVWIRFLSAIYIGKNEDIEKKLDELEEARFFDSEKEVKIIRNGNCLQAWYSCLQSGDRVWKRSYTVRNPEFGGKIHVTCILNSDEDGQTYISDEKLSGWEEK